MLNLRFLGKTERPIQETLSLGPLLGDGGTHFPSACSYSDAIWSRFIEPPHHKLASAVSRKVPPTNLWPN